MPSGLSLYMSSRPQRSWCMSIANGEQVMQRGIYRLADYLFEQFMLMLIQSQLPEGATLLGTLISSDKTNISAMTGDWVAHPLLISLTDIIMDFWTKASNHAFILLAILPVPKFSSQKQEDTGHSWKPFDLWLHWFRRQALEKGSWNWDYDVRSPRLVSVLFHPTGQRHHRHSRSINVCRR